MYIYGTQPTIGEDNKFHYVYRITNIVENKHYYGSRTSTISPYDDLGKFYFSSSCTNSWIKLDQIQNINNYKYKILKTFYTRKTAIEFECKLHEKFDVGNSEQFYNAAKQTNTKFNSDGKFAARNKLGEIFYINRKDPRFISGELVHIAKGKIRVYDETNKIITVDVNDPKFISGEYVCISKNKTNIIDENKNIIQITVNDLKFISGELISIHKNKVPVSDKNGHKCRVYRSDSRFVSGELFIVEGHTHKNFKYWRKTPWGIFDSRTALEPEISGRTLDGWCGKRNNEKLTKTTYNRCKIFEKLGENCIGKTFKELGFDNLNNEEYQQL